MNSAPFRAVIAAIRGRGLCCAGCRAGTASLKQQAPPTGAGNETAPRSLWQRFGGFWGLEKREREWPKRTATASIGAQPFVASQRELAVAAFEASMRRRVAAGSEFATSGHRSPSHRGRAASGGSAAMGAHGAVCVAKAAWVVRPRRFGANGARRALPCAPIGAVAYVSAPRGAARRSSAMKKLVVGTFNVENLFLRYRLLDLSLIHI